MMAETIGIYLLKNIVCAGVLMAYYRVALRDKQFHYYNRFYLLSTAVISLVVPLLHLNWFEVQNNDGNITRLMQLLSAQNSVAAKAAPQSTGWQSLLPWLFAASCLVLLVIYLVRVYRLYLLRKQYPVQEFEGIHLVNTDLAEAPFSFFQHLFWRSDIALNDATGRQILRHELTHIRQKHSYDKLFVQLLLCICWVNPFYYLLRRELSMIHEFIADEKAVNGKDASALAAMLLRSQGLSFNHEPALPFLYSPIKRRISMLANSSQPRYSYLRRLMLLPLLAIVTGLFAFTLAHQPAHYAEAARSVYADDAYTTYSDTTKHKKAGADSAKSKTYVIQLDKYDTGSLKGDTKLITILSNNVIIKTDSAVIRPDTLHPILDPLYIIDGAEAIAADMRLINPADIQSVSILKGASAEALYGLKGKGGVILIATKKGSGAVADSTTQKRRFIIVKDKPDPSATDGPSKAEPR